MSDGEPPILVTGAHRSGTTWVGRMLTLSPSAHYVHEPFAPMNDRSWLPHPPEVRYISQDPAADGPWAADLDRIVDLRPPRAALLRRAGSVRALGGVVRELFRAELARRAGARALIKDPLALMSAEWIHSRTGADVIVLLRHPAAFASSIERLGWRLDVSWLLQQERLMEGDLQAHRSALERDAELDTIGHANIVWSAMVSVINRLRREHPDWIVMRYEDLAQEPVAGFRMLYDSVGLPFNEQIASRIRLLNSSSQPADVARRARGDVVRDSRSAIWTWRSRLNASEIERVREETGSAALGWYDDPSWWPVT